SSDVCSSDLGLHTTLNSGFNGVFGIIEILGKQLWVTLCFFVSLVYQCILIKFLLDEPEMGAHEIIQLADICVSYQVLSLTYFFTELTLFKDFILLNYKTVAVFKHLLVLRCDIITLLRICIMCQQVIDKGPVLTAYH